MLSEFLLQKLHNNLIKKIMTSIPSNILDADKKYVYFVVNCICMYDR